MTADEFRDELDGYAEVLKGIASRFCRAGNSLIIFSSDRNLFRQTVQEVVDLIRDGLVDPDAYATQVESAGALAENNFIGSPSKLGVESVTSLVRSLCTRVRRRPDLILVGSSDVPTNLIYDPFLAGMLHHRVVFFAKPRFEAGQYADAVESVLKELKGRAEGQVW